MILKVAVSIRKLTKYFRHSGGPGEGVDVNRASEGGLRYQVPRAPPAQEFQSHTWTWVCVGGWGSRTRHVSDVCERDSCALHAVFTSNGLFDFRLLDY